MEKSIKNEAHKLLDNLPDKASWDDIVYAFHVRASVEAGLADCEAGRVKSTEEIRKKFGLIHRRDEGFYVTPKKK